VQDSPAAFLLELVRHPITLALTLGVALTILSTTPLWPRLRAALARPRRPRPPG
jgi:hypothetical protein